MNGNVHFIIITIDNSYHLLIRITCGYPYKTTKPTYTKVYMNNKITRPHLLQFFHRKCNLSCTSAIRFKIVLVKTVKYLMIGKKASP